MADKYGNLHEKWSKDKNQVETEGEATYDKPLEIIDDTDKTFEEIMNEISREKDTDTIEEK